MSVTVLLAQQYILFTVLQLGSVMSPLIPKHLVVAVICLKKKTMLFSDKINPPLPYVFNEKLIRKEVKCLVRVLMSNTIPA